MEQIDKYKMINFIVQNDKNHDGDAIVEDVSDSVNEVMLQCRDVDFIPQCTANRIADEAAHSHATIFGDGSTIVKIGDYVYIADKCGIVYRYKTDAIVATRSRCFSEAKEYARRDYVYSMIELKRKERELLNPPEPPMKDANNEQA